MPTLTAAALVAACHDPWSFAAFLIILLMTRLPREPRR